MRPEILNPLFAETLVLKGVGPALAKPLDRLGLARVVDVAFHLPTGYVDRVPRTDPEAVQTILEFMGKKGAPLETFYDNSIVDKLAREGFFDNLSKGR